MGAIPIVTTALTWPVVFTLAVDEGGDFNPEAAPVRVLDGASEGSATHGARHVRIPVRVVRVDYFDIKNLPGAPVTQQAHQCSTGLSGVLSLLKMRSQLDENFSRLTDMGFHPAPLGLVGDS